jgi:hypothetical protein
MLGGLGEKMQMVLVPGGAEADRARAFREQHKSMGIFYRLLDVPYGVDLSTADVARIKTVPSLVLALILDGGLAILFGAIWFRYDLASTWNTLDPFAQGLQDAVPNAAAVSIPYLDPAANAFLSAALGVFLFIFDFLIRIVVTFGPSFIQFRMPYMAMNHDAAWFALWSTAVFDMATDSPDIRADVPRFFGWLLTAAEQANSTVWLSIALLCLIMIVFKFRLWKLWLILAGVAIACVMFGQARNIIFWSNIGFWTVFASFASQSLFLIQAVKTGLIAMKLKTMLKPVPVA